MPKECVHSEDVQLSGWGCVCLDTLGEDPQIGVVRIQATAQDLGGALGPLAVCLPDQGETKLG